MDAKLNQSDLISLLAKGNNISVAKAELFTKNFFDLVIEGLEQDGIVKINGLGTFKVTDVASRGSVNVNTGEKIEIKGHKKLTFIPADALKEQVNLPFAMFEPVEVDDTYQPDSNEEGDSEETVETVETTETAVEPVVVQPVAEEVPVATVEEGAAEGTVEEAVEETATADEPEAAVVEEVAVEESVAKETTEEPVVIEKHEESVAEETVEQEAVVPVVEENVEETPEPESQEAPVVVQERPSEPVIVRVPPKKSAQEKQPLPSKRKKSRLSYYLIAIMAIAVALILINRTGADDVAVVEEVKETVPAAVEEPKSKPVIENVAAETADVEAEPVEETVAVEAVVEEPVAAEPEKVVEPAPLPVAEQSAGEYEFVLVDELAAKNLKYITLADTTLYVAEGDLAVHKVAPDETLTRIAREYYGDKRLWPYIVKYNNMSNPNGLCRGMEIAIPRLTPKK